MTKLYITESPFQLLSAIEANHFFGGDALLIIKYTSHQKNDEQIRKMKSLSSFQNIIEITPRYSNDEANIRLFFLLKQFIRQNRKFDKIFIGEYRSFHMRKFFDTLSPRECFLLDDGSITPELQYNYLPCNKDYFGFESAKGYLKKIIYAAQNKLFRFQKKTRRDIHLFTCFDLSPHRPSQQIIKHTFPFIKSFLKSKNITHEIVYFYGSNMKLLGIDIDLEITYLRYIIDYYSTKNIRLVYIPHRKEEPEKIAQLSSTLQIEIKYNHYPAEIALIFDETVPNHLASFVSTVLATLPVIYDFKTVTAFFPPLGTFYTRYQEELKTQKLDYQKSMLVVDLT